jgi:hypothetical protein
MSKRKTKKQLSYLDELNDRGTVVVSAKTRDELTEIVSNISATIRYSVGAIGKNNDSGLFTLRIDLIK